MRKKVLFILVFVFIFAGRSMALTVHKEYPFIYKSTRALGMGGAYMVSGSDAGVVFYNPAGLSNIPRSFGFEIDIINFAIAINKNTVDFVNDMMDVFDIDNTTEQLKEALNVLKEYRGKNFHLAITDFSSISRKHEKLAWSLGIIGTFYANGRTHQGFGTTGLLEVELNSYVGGVMGVSYDFFERKLSLGLALKYIHAERFDHAFTAKEIIDHQDDLQDYLMEDLRKSGDAFGADVGLIYRPFAAYESGILGFLTPAFAVSYTNIGMDFGDAGEIPATFNIGVAVFPKILSRCVVEFDYVDVFNAYEEDSDFGKRTRFGAELRFIDKPGLHFALNGGLYQGYWTAGVDFRFLFLRLQVSSYAEEVGAYAGQDEDRRYVFSMAINF